MLSFVAGAAADKRGDHAARASRNSRREGSGGIRRTILRVGIVKVYARGLRPSDGKKVARGESNGNGKAKERTKAR